MTSPLSWFPCCCCCCCCWWWWWWCWWWCCTSSVDSSPACLCSIITVVACPSARGEVGCWRLRGEPKPRPRSSGRSRSSVGVPPGSVSPLAVQPVAVHGELAITQSVGSCHSVLDQVALARVPCQQHSVTIVSTAREEALNTVTPPKTDG